MKLFVLILFFSILNGQVLDNRYHRTDEIYHFLDTLSRSETVGEWVHLDTVGYSTQENIPIIAIRISDNAHIKEDEPRVLFIGQVHAEEILGVEVVISMIKDLLFPDASSYTHMNILKQYIDIWFIPTANPEGLNVVYESQDLSYRKNKRDLSPDGPFPNNVFDYDPSIGNDVDGVDLNRNFGFNWTFGDTFLEPDNSDYASHYDYYKGEEPFSESEAVAIRDLALENDFVFSIVWHSSRSGNLSEKVFTSWKWEDVKESPDIDIMKSIGDNLANLIITEDGSSTYLSVFSGSRNGKLHDWFYRETGSIQYLVECGTSNLQPDSLLVEDTIERSKPAMVYLMDRAIGYYTDASQITGVVYNSNTGLPLENVHVDVLERSGGVLKPRLTNEFGRYRRILDVGTYTLSFKADGFNPLDISVVANNSGITNYDVYLEPSDMYRLNIHLLHLTNENITIPGILRNEVHYSELNISTGENSFILPSGTYNLELPMDGEHVPWYDFIILESDIYLTIPFETGVQYDIDMSMPWLESEGQWCSLDSIIRSHEGSYYNNGESANTEQYMESELFDVTNTNRLVASIKHRYETEWDYDEISLSILDKNDSVLSNRFWDGDNWEKFHLDHVTAKGYETDSIKIRVEFYADQTVNYRGWEIENIRLHAIQDNYLRTQNRHRNSSPNIPLTISGIYPNPSYGRYNVDLKNFPGGSASIQVYNLLGQNIFNQSIDNLSKGDRLIGLDLRTINSGMIGSGMFFLKIQTQNEQAVKKCILLKN